MQRATSLNQLTNHSEPFDFLIIGGGATGLGAAVDAANRGYRVALIEQADFAKGTSSRSTKLVHGGVRYLKQGDIQMVREALHERGLLHTNAPHLVHNMAFVIPAYGRWDQMFYGVGLKAYDALAGKLGLGSSRLLSREETLAAIPTVEPEHLTGGVLYHDGQFNDSRLAVNLAQTAVEAGACLANYVKAVGLVKENGRTCGVEAQDIETGQQWVLRARCVINATGVFVDAIRQHDDPAAEAMLAVSQGVHLVLPKEFLPGDSAIMVPKTSDDRVLFAVPWEDAVVVGTTDTPVPEHSLEPRALEAEKEFLMTHAAKYLARDPSPADVLSIFAGLRPLVKQGEGTRTAALSRDHTILVSESGLVTITGGKWTTYRRMGEDVIDHAEQVAGLEKRPCTTEELRVHGWKNDDASQSHLKTYGTDATIISALAREKPALAERLHPALPQIGAEVVWHARKEMARTVEDVLARRTRMLLLNARASIEAAPRVAELLAAELGHDEAWQAAQVAAYNELAQGYVFTA